MTGGWYAHTWIPAFAGMTAEWIRAFAGMTAEWIRAFAGMTTEWIPAFAGTAGDQRVDGSDYAPGTPISVILVRSSTLSISLSGRTCSRFTRSRINTPSFTDLLLMSAAFA